MPPQNNRTVQGRTTRSRVHNENDENNGSRVMTRAGAKAAALNVDNLSLPPKPLQNKRSTANISQTGQRKRAALGDVSNVTKVEPSEVKKGGKAVVTSKTTNRVTKSTASRATGMIKETKKEVKTRAGHGGGAIGIVPKRKTSSNVAAKEAPAEEEPVRKKLHAISEVEKLTTVELKQTTEVYETDPPVQPIQTYPPGVKDLDTDDLEDTLMVAEYATDIFEYLRDLELNSLPNPEYMAHQDDLEWKTRGILIDWLIEVHTRFHLLPETLFLAVNIIDRFLSEKIVQLDRLQLVGITAMFIASKYEEVLSPHVGNFRHVADDGFSEDEILSAERFILSTLHFDLSYPNPMNFLRRISKADNYDIQSRTVGKYLMEISLLDHRFMNYRPSHVAAAAMYLARLILDRGEWDETLTYYAGYTEEEIAPVFMLMVDYLARPVVHEAFFKKYAGKKFLKASIMTRSWAKKNACIFGIADVSKSVDDIS